ncbi:MAG: cbb3-type cytochrome oxidase subunit 3 [Gemmatimonadales bacterium]
MRLTDIMSGSGLSGYATIALILFMAAFLAIVVRTFLPSRKREMDEHGRIPLDDYPQATSPRKGARS